MSYSWSEAIDIIDKAKISACQRAIANVMWSVGQAIENGVKVDPDSIVAMVKEYEHGK